MIPYLELVKRVRDTGLIREDRTGTGTISVFGAQVTFDLREGFPATTTKRLAFKQVLGELLCFIHGKDNLDDFHKLGVKIWDANAKATNWSPRVPGDIGRIYGVQWRDWQGTKCSVDQLTDLIANLKAIPYSRRHVVTAWQPAELDQMCLPPCHILFQCYVSNGHLDLRVDMRSVDLFLGMPFDVASYAVLLSMLAQEVGLESRYLIFQLGDAHIYLNHIDQVQEMLIRKPRKLPILVLAKKSIFDLTMDDVSLKEYDPWPTISAEMSV